jgi:endonuclease III
MAKGPSPQKRAADRRKRRRLADVVLESLGERYEHPAWAGPRVDTVSELVLTILSQNTADVNSFRAFTALRDRYATWDAVLAAPTDELEDVIRPGGLAPTKSRRIQHVLAEVHEATAGTWDLSFLGTMPLVEARDWLTALPGIGRKTAAIILLFGFGRPQMPVDTHVHRVATRLGMLPPRTPLPKAHDLLEEVLEPGEMYPFHVETIRHGRDTCRAPRPICGLCPLTDACAYYVLAARGKAPMAPVPKSFADPAAPPRYHDQLIHGWMPPEQRTGPAPPPRR